MCVCLYVCVCVGVTINDYLNIEKSPKHNMALLAWVFKQENTTTTYVFRSARDN